MTPPTRRIHLIALVCAVGAFGLLYQDVFVALVANWYSDENYSHSFVVLPAIGYLVWLRRERLAATPFQPSNLGLLLLAAGLALLFVGTAGVEFFLMRASAVAVIAGMVLFLGGWQWLRLLAFPIGLTALIIPIPPVLFYQVAFPLQLSATKFGVGALELLRIPVLREGNVIVLAHTTLEVTEACSGIRSLISLSSLAVLYGYFVDPRPLSRVVIACSSIPIAIISNGLRVAGTGIAAHYVGESAATGFFHAFSGWVVFMTSFAMLLLVAAALKRLPSFTAAPQPELSVS